MSAKADIDLNNSNDPAQAPPTNIVLWTRGKHTGYVARLLSPSPERVEGDLKGACIASRADLLVTAKSSSFDLVSTAIPQGIDEKRAIAAVVGAVGTGPHSSLAATVAAKLAKSLQARPQLVTVSREESDDAEAGAALDRLRRFAPHAKTQIVRADTAVGLLESLPDDGLLVLGAPGGSWWQRQFFGPGRRLIHRAPAGSIVVRAAPRRCFHGITEITPLGRFMGARDAATVLSDAAAPVADEGRLIGLVWRHALAAAGGSATVENLMEDPIFVRADDPLEAAGELAADMKGAPVPVVDDDDHVLGGIRI